MRIDSYMPVRIVSGNGCLKSNEQLLLSVGKNCFIVTGQASAKKSGALDDVLEIFNKHSVEYFIFNEIEPNPQTVTCKSAGMKARELDCDYILGIGGGSVLDAAKAVAIYHALPEIKHSEIYNRKAPVSHIPVILIGTTSGTGSEVTGVSVLTNSDNGLKKSISGPDCYAELAFCDSKYTKSVPSETKVSACLDAFSHAVEAFFASSCNDIVEIYSKKAVSIIAPYIIDNRFDKLNDDDIDKLYQASIYAGLAINIAGTCFPHTVGYYLTESHNIPHGKACAAFFNILTDRAKKYCPEKFEAMEGLISCDFELFSEKVSKLSDVRINASEEEINRIASRWHDGVKNFDRTPGGFSYIDARNALLTLIS